MGDAIWASSGGLGGIHKAGLVKRISGTASASVQPASPCSSIGSPSALRWRRR